MFKQLLAKLAPEFGIIREGTEEDKSKSIEAEVEQEVLNKLDRSAKLDEVETVTFGLETDDGKIVKVYIKAEQAEEFEKALSSKLGEVDDIEEALNELSKEFEIVDVDWPEEQEGEEQDPDEAAAEDGSAAMNANVYKKKKEEEATLEGLNTGERAQLALLEGDGNTIEGRLNTAAQLMVYHAILELGIPEVALNRNPYRSAIVKGIRDVAYQLSRNTAMKQALKMFVKKSVDHDEKDRPPEDDEGDNKHGDKKPVKEGATFDETLDYLTEGVAQEFWTAFNALIKYVAPDNKLAAELLDNSKLQQLVSRSSGALTSRVNSSMRTRMRDLVKAMEAGGPATPDKSGLVTESATVDEVTTLINDLLTLADTTKDGSMAKAVMATMPFRMLSTKMKVGLSQKFIGQARSKLNNLKTVLTATQNKMAESVTPAKLLEDKCKWELDKTEEGLSISCSFIKMVLGEEDSEKLAKAITNRDAVVVRDIEGKKFVFSPRGLNIQVKAVGGTTSYMMEVKDVDALAELAATPSEDETGEEDSGREPVDKKNVKESLGGLGTPTENKPGMKTWSYDTEADFTADCKRLKYSVDEQNGKLHAKNTLGQKVGEFALSSNSGWLRQK